ncbi:RND family transporter [Kordiimonas lipolytica]|uniref:RND family transporter n=1 Tax=Kordiimonas lipolytica TaxID=1662421 RepID=A0ABV8UCC0_9PROT|nr:MMPL family transporter [Kordiimonas lipolytica]
MLALSEHAVKRPKHWFWLASLASLLLIVAVALPSLAPNYAPGFLNPLKIDTDPENMLSADEPVRVFHNEKKAAFGLYDMVVVGVVNEANPNGVFNQQSLADIYSLTETVKSLDLMPDEDGSGIITADIIAPSTVDNIEQAGLGAVRFNWLMQSAPTSEADAKAVAQKAAHIPLLDNTLVSDDRKALALYIPIASKDLSYTLAEEIRAATASHTSGNVYHITGLPVAQDQFGVEMFVQMAISAPMAMLLIFALMWYFFRNLKLIAAPMIVAMIAVILTMGLLVATGNTVHIMSSMIPIFIMPIAVLDAVHILSDFFDRYKETGDRGKTVRAVMEELAAPMFFTTLTTCAGFASLAFTPIPPVQVFGVFVAIGVFMAWILTVTLVPAYIMLMNESSFSDFGHGDAGEESGLLNRTMAGIARLSFGRAKLLVLLTLLISTGALYGISKIQINDNPVKWFSENHPIREADRALNERFAGTYMAYLTLGPASDEAPITAQSLMADMPTVARAALDGRVSDETTPADIKSMLYAAQDAVESDADWDALDSAITGIDAKLQAREIFKRPDVLAYIEKLQAHLLTTGLVGKTNALTDVVKTVHRALYEDDEAAYRLPATSAAVAQTLLTYESSHRPQDLWHFVTPDYRETNIWLQLTSGDNKDMKAVVDAVDAYVADNPMPAGLTHNWFGLTYINVVWQEKMVAGMLEAFAGSFIIVLVMMAVLFRSPLWGVLAMLPLSVTILVIYGLIGLIGKDYDMPVAVLSALSLGLAVDYAIHFLARSRQIASRFGNNWGDAISTVFGEPARAISRNVIVIGVGFLPLLAAPLVPYQTVGVFISAILLLAGAVTLLLLPSLITILQKYLFPKKDGAEA